MTSATQNKTIPTTTSISDFLADLTPLRREETEKLIFLMQSISARPPILWSYSILGFGSQHYRYETGREGDMPLLAFSPRKAAITVYFPEGFHHYAGQLSHLGKHKTSVSCLYINKLSDIDLAVLKEMLEASWKLQAAPQGRATSIEEYVQPGSCYCTPPV
jgi:hypothetical protein